MVKILALLLMDAALLAAGVALILSYLDARARTADASMSKSAPALPASSGASSGASSQDATESAFRERIAAVVDQHRTDIQTCYSDVSQGLEPDARPAGRLHIAFTIEPSGRVARAEAAIDETGSPALTDCVVALFSGFEFAERPGGQPIDMVWPLLFQTPK